MKEVFYRVIRKSDDYMYPIRFETFEQAENFIFKLGLWAYITIR